MSLLRKIYKSWWLRGILLFFLVCLLALFLLARKPVPEKIEYGISFNTLYARELGLDWRETYDALLGEVGVRHLRLAAHWDMVEPEKDQYNFSELDYQLEKAESAGATVILGVGRRLPRWPECHVPDWASNLSWEAQKEEIKEYIEVVVTRYKDHDAIRYWQVENEPFLTVFATEHCGDTLDKSFLQEEVELVKSLDDKNRPVLVTDSGNLGLWSGAYQAGDVFGTSVYLHFWNPEVGQFTTIMPAWGYRIKDNLMRLLHGDKPTILIELATEPWLTEPIVEVPVETQLTRMNLPMIKDTIEYAAGTRYDTQYLWGGEWWYWLHKRGHSDIWNWAKEFYGSQNTVE